MTGGAAVAFALVRPILDKASKRAAVGQKGGSKTEDKQQSKIEDKTEANAKQVRGGVRGRGRVRDRYYKTIHSTSPLGALLRYQLR